MAAAPAWVTRTDLPYPDPAYVAQGSTETHSILIDTQLRLEGDTLVEYDRYAAQVVDRSGLEQLATVKREFDPHSQTLDLVSLQVWRDGKPIDQKSDVSPRVLQREGDLENGILTGTLTVVIDLADVRVGDIVDVAFVRTSRPPIPGAPASAGYYVDFFYPVERMRISVLWPKDKPLHFGSLAPGFDPVVTKGVTEDHYLWDTLQPAPLLWEDASPALKDGRRSLFFSNAESWESLVTALTPHYTADYPLTPDWEAKLAAIAASGAPPADQAIAALRLVQEEIRYLSLSIGAGGYLARPPAEVIATGYGDCKDKSLLLRTLLSRLDIPAEVALTDFEWSHVLPEMPARLNAFDHMILRARPESGGELWMDPTSEYMGGDATHAVTPDFGHALPIGGPGPVGLAVVTQREGDRWLTDVTETFRFSFLGVSLVVDSTYKGRAADHRRSLVARDGLAKMTRDFETFYANSYPGIRSLAQIVTTDDPVTNTVTLREEYGLPVTALSRNGLRQNFPFEAENFVLDVPKVQINARQAPLHIGTATRMAHRVRVLNAPILFNPPEDRQLSNAGFDLDFNAEVAEDQSDMTLEWVYTTKAREVAAKDVAEVIEDARELRSNLLYYSWDLTAEAN